MSKKASILVIVLLLAGAAAIAIVKTRDAGGEKPSGADTGGSAKVVKPSAGSGSSGGQTAAKVVNRSAREIRNAELVEKYGSPRTNLSRQVSENVVSLMDDAVSLGEMMSQRSAEFGGGRMVRGMVQRRTGVELREDQQDKVAEMYAEFQKRELEKFKGSVDDLRKDPSALMELFLAGDANARSEMSAEEYAQVQSSAGEQLAEVINPLDRDNFRPGNPMDDMDFRRDFEAMLDDDQLAAMTAKEAEREAASAPDGEAGDANSDDAVSERSIANIPTMELEKLDEAVGSAKQMTSGFRMMMEGMGGLNDMQSQLKPEPDGQGE